MTRKRRLNSHDDVHGTSGSLLCDDNKKKSWKGKLFSSMAGYGDFTDELNDSSSFVSEFERKYGYVDENKVQNRNTGFINQPKNGVAETSVTSFPSELVSYLQEIVSMLDDDSHNENELENIRERCLEECETEKLTLLNYDISSKLIEKIFGSHQPAAIQWITMFCGIKMERQIQLLCCGFSCHTIETFLHSLSLDSDVETVEPLVDPITNNWIDIIMHESSSRFVRSLMRFLVGLPRFDSCNREITTKIDKQKKYEPNSQSQRIFNRIAVYALDFLSMKHHMDIANVSLVMQDAVECDLVAGTKCVLRFVMQSIEDPVEIINQWIGKHSSRVWQKIVESIDEVTLQAVYNSFPRRQLRSFACHKYANYALKSLVFSASTEKMVVDIFDNLISEIPQMILCERWQLVHALTQLASKFVVHQEALLKTILSCFGCDRIEMSKFIVPKLITINENLNPEELKDDCGMLNFDVRRCCRKGSVLLQTLLNFNENEMIISSLNSLSRDCLLKLCLNPFGAFLLTSYFQCSTVKKNDKQQLGNKLKDVYETLIYNKSGSYVFEAMWNSGNYTLNDKLRIMTALRTWLKKNKSKKIDPVTRRLNLCAFIENPRKWMKQEKTRMQLFHKKNSAS